MISIETKGIKSNNISHDLSRIFEGFEKTLSEKQSDLKTILFYIDATNGELTFSIYDLESLENDDDTMYVMKMMSLWKHLDNDGYGATDFDVIVTKSIKKAFKSKVGKRLKSGYEIFLQTEEDEPMKI